VIVTHDGSEYITRFQTLTDATEVVELLEQLGISADRFVKA
jgi:hypothetical protein